MRNQAPRITNNGTVGEFNNDKLTTHLFNIKATIAIRCADEGKARHLFGRITNIAHQKGIKLGYVIDEVIDMGKVIDNYTEDIHRELEIMKEKKSLRNEFGE